MSDKNYPLDQGDRAEFLERIAKNEERLNRHLDLIEELQEKVFSIEANILNWQDAWVKVSNSYLSFNDKCDANRGEIAEFQEWRDIINKDHQQVVIDIANLEEAVRLHRSDVISITDCGESRLDRLESVLKDFLNYFKDEYVIGDSEDLEEYCRERDYIINLINKLFGEKEGVIKSGK